MTSGQVELLREMFKYLKVKDRTIYRVVAEREIPGFEGGGILEVQEKRDRPVDSRNVVGLDDIGEPVERKQ